MPISPELAAVYTSAPVARHYVETLSLEHPGFPETRYITNQRTGWTATLEDGVTIVDFLPLPFQVIPPRAEGEGQVSLQVQIDNASRQLMEDLETLALTPTEPIMVTYRVYLSDDNVTVQNSPPMVLDIQSVVANQTTISFNAGLTNLRNRPFPKILYTTATFPGLSR